MKMGTVEPIYVENEKVQRESDVNDRMAFIRGMVKKYKNTELDIKEVFEYLERMVK